jgi:hypothetical protein
VPTTRGDLDKRHSNRDEVRRPNRRRSDQRGNKRSRPLGILVVELLSFIVGCGIQACAEVNVRETGRCAAHQEDAQRCDTGDCSERNQGVVAFPEVPDKRHLCTPLLNR